MTDKMERIIFYKPIVKSNCKAEYFYTLIMFTELLKYHDNALTHIFLLDMTDVTFDFLKLFDLSIIQKMANVFIVSI